MAERGTPITTSLLKKFVSAIIKRNGRPIITNLQKGPSRKWCRRYFAENPMLRKRRPDRADTGRMKRWRDTLNCF